MGQKTKDLRLNFFSKIKKLKTGCWKWQAKLSKTGYPEVWSNYKGYLAHRVSYELHYGPIPKKKVIDHLCRNRWCVNPEHLEIVTQRDNILRGQGHAGRNARKSRCKRGHLFTEDNIYRRKDRKYPQRACRKCIAYHSRKARAKIKHDAPPVPQRSSSSFHN